jgi:hypothetical protein
MEGEREVRGRLKMRGREEREREREREKERERELTMRTSETAVKQLAAASALDSGVLSINFHIEKRTAEDGIEEKKEVSGL